jgi:hypothetical protein
MGETNIGALTSGMLKVGVAGGVATPATATPGTDFYDPQAVGAPSAAELALSHGSGSGTWQGQLNDLSNLIAADYSHINTASATGSESAMLADYTPDITLSQGQEVILVNTQGANVGAVTFAPDGLTAKAMVSGDAAALTGGECGGVGYRLHLIFSTALDKWVLLNPAKIALANVTGAGAAAALAVGTTAGTVAAGNDGRFSTAMWGSLTGDNQLQSEFMELSTFNFNGALSSLYIGAGPVKQYLTRTEEFTDAAWVKTDGSTVTVTAIGQPNRASGTGAGSFAGSGANSTVRMVKTEGTTGNWTFSIWLKASTGTPTIPIRVTSTDNSDVEVETATTNCLLSSTVWKRFSVTKNFASAHTKKRVYVDVGNTTIYAYGPNLAPYVYATPYWAASSAQKTTEEYCIVLPGYSYGTATTVYGTGITARSFYGVLTGAFLNASQTALGQKYVNYAAGTIYTLTNTPAAVVFGTTSPTVTIVAAGIYRIGGLVNLKLNGATFAANRTVTLSIQKTNGTPSTLATIPIVTPIVTTLTQTMLVVPLPEVVFTAAANDIVTIYASIDVVPSAGTLDVDLGTSIWANCIQ